METIARVFTLVALLASAETLAIAESYQCQDSTGCTATITEEGELKEIAFRKGDIVSTEDGWVVHPDDGWEKVRDRLYWPSPF